MLILGNYKGNYDTATTTAIKSMGFDLNVTQSYFSYKYFLTESGQHLMLVPNKRRKRSKFMYIVYEQTPPPKNWYSIGIGIV